MKLSSKTLEAASSKMASVVFNKKLDRIYEQRMKLISELVKKYIPQEVLDCASKYPKFFYLKNYISLCKEDGSQPIYTSCVEYIPSPQSLSISNEDYSKLEASVEEYRGIEQKKSSYSCDVYHTLMGLGTTARITKAFPEALNYIDSMSVPKKSLPACNKLRETLTLAEKEGGRNETDK